ncbi:MAG: hypothetical protein JRF41_06355 [Deltaproteobacteria bacterium]|nr:hypothetical protein [Deltaproteobacteria bacterium]
MSLDNPKIKKVIRDRSLYMCLECGKCSASCPRMLTGKEYSPRLLAQKLMNHSGRHSRPQRLPRTRWSASFVDENDDFTGA